MGPFPVAVEVLADGEVPAVGEVPADVANLALWCGATVAAGGSNTTTTRDKHRSCLVSLGFIILTI